MVTSSRVFATVAVGFLGAAEGIRMARKKSRTSCGVKGASASAHGGVNMSIVNGDDAEECEWKWQVSFWDKGGNYPFCGGTLIDPEWVLTAAHCVGNPSFSVKAGDYKYKTTSNNQQQREAVEVVAHPEYDDSTMTHDFALVRVDTAFDITGCVGLACLPERDVADGTTCWISGWGTLKSDGSQPNIMQEGAVDIISNKRCTGEFDYGKSDIDESMMCAQGRTDRGQTIDACQGDSGGPLVCEVKGKWEIHGATSWGYGCAQKVYPGIYARITTELDWIDATMSGETVTNPPGSGESTCAAIGCGAGYEPNRECQCNEGCLKWGNCCTDYSSGCGGDSCRKIGCEVKYNQSLGCQCNSKCPDYSNCCTDFYSECQ